MKVELNKQDLCKKFKNAVEELSAVGDIEEAMRCMIELTSPEMNCELIAYCMEWAVEQHKDKHRKSFQRFLSTGLERGIIDHQAIDAGFRNFVSKLPDKMIDVPLATKHTVRELWCEDSYLFVTRDDLVATAQKAFLLGPFIFRDANRLIFWDHFWPMELWRIVLSLAFQKT